MLILGEYKNDITQLQVIDLFKGFLTICHHDITIILKIQLYTFLYRVTYIDFFKIGFYQNLEDKQKRGGFQEDHL